MKGEDLKDYNNLVDIINEVQEHFAKLDDYRKESDPLEKKKRLFAVHSVEGRIRKMIKQELDRLELRELTKNQQAA